MSIGRHAEDVFSINVGGKKYTVSFCEHRFWVPPMVFWLLGLSNGPFGRPKKQACRMVQTSKFKLNEKYFSCPNLVPYYLINFNPAARHFRGVQCQRTKEAACF
jgi:hypothetical protein